MIEIRLPQFGMGMSDGTIIKWHKSEGDQVAKGEPLCDIEAAKTTVEFESPETGVLRKIVVAVDENVPVNTVIAQFEVGGAPSTEEAAPEIDPAVAEGESDSDLDKVVRISPLAKREAQASGIDVSSVQGSGPRGKIVRADLRNEADAVGPSSGLDPAVQIEPRARRVARDLNVDLTAVIGTGPGGRIVAEDVEAFAKSPPAPARQEKQMTTAAEVATHPSQQAEAASADTGDTQITHSMMRRTIAKRLTESKSTVPHFYLRASCRIDALLSLRAQINDGADVKVSVNDLVVRAVALALKAVPDANVAWGEKAMTKFANVDVAVAVATPRGLVTPIVRQVNLKPIRQIAAEIKDLAARGKEGKLKPEEYQGGNTSVSNLGMFGVEEFSAILNPPQSSIFAVGAGEQRAIVVDGKVEVATMMNVTVSLDHRAVDGAVGAQMLAAFKALIETPARILA